MTLLLKEFKKSKKEFKYSASEIADSLDELTDERDLNRKQKNLTGLKSKVAQNERTLMELESRWEMLDSQDKAMYRSKVAKFRQEYEQLRKKFHKLDDAANSEANRQRLAYNSNTNGYSIDDGDQGLRKKLLNGREELHEQEKQLDNTKRMGMEANVYMREANKRLREDRDILIGVNEKNAQIRVDLERGNKIITDMSMREYVYKLLIHATAFLLLIALIAVFINKLVK